MLESRNEKVHLSRGLFMNGGDLGKTVKIVTKFVIDPCFYRTYFKALGNVTIPPITFYVYLEVMKWKTHHSPPRSSTPWRNVQITMTQKRKPTCKASVRVSAFMILKTSGEGGLSLPGGLRGL